LQEQLAAVQGEKEEMAKKVVAAEIEKKDAAMNAFVTKLIADNVCTKAMEPFVRALVGDEKETYSIGEKTMDKFALVTEVLTLGVEASKVNFKENTTVETLEKSEDLHTQIEKYCQEHKVEYSDGYRAVTKGMKLEAKSLVENERD